MQIIFEEFGKGTLQRLPHHKNPGLEIVYLRHGHLVWECDGKPEAVPPESLYFTLPWQEHGSAWEFEPGHYWYFVVLRLEDESKRLRFSKALGFDSATERMVRRRLVQASRHSLSAPPLVRALMPALVEELEHPGALHQPLVSRMAAQLVLELARLLGKPKDTRRQDDADRFSALLTELRRTCAEPWTLEKMAARLQLRRTRFSALFRHYTGDTPLHYLLRLRVEQARHLLRTTDRNVTDIAMACGFASSQHLARIFHQFTGVTASAYRRHGAPLLHLPRGRSG
jgi:AraC-like DNA-binding protein